MRYGRFTVTTDRPLTARWRRLLLALCVLCALPALVAPAYAGQGVTTYDLAFGEAGEREFQAGQVLRPREPLWWESDVPWRIMVEALDPYLGTSDDGSYVKPLGDLQFKLSEESQWTELRQQPQELKSSTQTGSGTFTVDWRVLLKLTHDRAGRYEATLRFTITAL